MQYKQNSGVMRVDKDVEEAIRDLAAKTRRSAAQILSELARYGLQHTRLEPVQLYDIRFDEKK